VGDSFHEILKLRAETNHALLDFIRTDLDLCLVFATVAETAYSMGRRAHAERNIANAEKGYSVLLRYYCQAKGMTAEVEMELWSKFQRLRDRLDGLQRRR
jgi:hypothetical protein